MPGEVLHIPTVAGAVVIVYNLPGVCNGLQLTPDVLADLFLGNLKRWDDKRIASLNPGVKLPGPGDRGRAPFRRQRYQLHLHQLPGRGEPRLVGARRRGQVRRLARRDGRLRQRRRRRAREADPRRRSATSSWPTRCRTSSPTATCATARASSSSPRWPPPAPAAAGSVKAMQRDVRVSIVNAADDDAYPIAGFTYLLVYHNQRSADRGQGGGGVPVVGHARRAEARREAALRPPARRDGGDRRGQDQVHDLRRACPALQIAGLLSPWAGAFSRPFGGAPAHPSSDGRGTIRAPGPRWRCP